MNIFVSHAIKDNALLQQIDTVLNSYGLNLLIAEHYFDSQSTISDKIRNLINSCDIGLVLLTENGFNSGFVREEIGHLDAKGKPIILVIEKGFEQKYSGFRYGHDFVLLDPLNPTITVEKIKKIMLRHWDKLQIEENKLRQLAAVEQARVNKNRLIAIGLLAGLFILGANE